MRYTISAKAGFSSSHQANEPLRCNMLHGHDYEVVAQMWHEMLDDGVPRGGRGFDLALGAICAELDERPLDKMAPGVNQTLVGLAAYIFERMLAKYPNLVGVSVSDGRYTGAVST